MKRWLFALALLSVCPAAEAGNNVVIYDMSGATVYLNSWGYPGQFRPPSSGRIPYWTAPVPPYYVRPRFSAPVYAPAYAPVYGPRYSYGYLSGI